VTGTGQQQLASIPLIPPLKQPTSVPSHPSQAAAAAAAKPKSKKVCSPMHVQKRFILFFAM